MRTTIRIDDGLLVEAKHEAIRSGRTLQEVVEDALRVALARRDVAASARPTLPVFVSRGVQPGVDLEDSAALEDLMDGLG